MARATSATGLDWVTQFEGSKSAYASGIVAAPERIYVGGGAAGPLDDQELPQGAGLFLRAYSPSGDSVWTREFGSEAGNGARAVALHESGVYVAGGTLGALPGQDYLEQVDAFVRKYNAEGDVLWTRQFGTPETERILAVDADATGVYVAGLTNGSFPDAEAVGGKDAFLRKYDHDGEVLWTRQFGTPPIYPNMGGEAATDVAAHPTGVYVAGWTRGTLPNQTRNATGGGWADGFLRKYDPNGTHLWTRQFGTGYSVRALAVAVASAGVYVGGQADGAFPGQEQLGFMDGFLLRYDHDGRLLWIRQVGTGRTDEVVALAANETRVYALGNTRGQFGATHHGEEDAFLAAFTPDGNRTWTFQFGTAAQDTADALALHPEGLFVAGWTEGALPGASEPEETAAFVAKIVPREVEPALLNLYLLVGGVGAVVAGVVAVLAVRGVLRGRRTRGTVSGASKPADPSTGDPDWRRHE